MIESNILNKVFSEVSKTDYFDLYFKKEYDIKVVADYNCSNIQFDGFSFYVNPLDVYNFDSYKIFDWVNKHFYCFYMCMPFNSLLYSHLSYPTPFVVSLMEKWPKPEQIILNDYYSPWFEFKKDFENEQYIIADLNIVASARRQIGIYRKKDFKKISEHEQLCGDLIQEYGKLKIDKNLNPLFKNKLKEVMLLATLLGYRVSPHYYLHISSQRITKSINLSNKDTKHEIIINDKDIKFYYENDILCLKDMEIDDFISFIKEKL